MCTLAGLVGGQRLGRIDVTEGRPGRRHGVVAGWPDTEPLAEHGDDRLRLHLPDARQAEETSLQAPAIGGLRPHPGRIVAVVARDRGAQCLDLAGHRAREAVDRRSLAKDVIQGGRIHGRDPGGVEVSQASLQVSGAAEGLLHRHLLVEREPDQQRQRLLHEQAVGGVIAGEGE